MNDPNAQRNPLLQHLRDRDRLLGCWTSLTSPIAAEVLGNVGFDWLLLDAEHAPNDISSLLHQLMALAQSASAVVVRPPATDRVVIKRLLDIGVRNLLLPLVDDADQAAAAVAATRYPPQGTRGVATIQRASGYGDDPEYFRHANEQVAVIVQIESATAVDNVEKIAQVDGVNALFVGPADLSASLGHFLQPEAPAVQQAIARVLAAGQAAGKSVGILAPVAQRAQQYLDQGLNLLAVASDIELLRRAGRAQLDALRDDDESPT